MFIPFPFMFSFFLLLRILDNGMISARSWVEIRQVTVFTRGFTVYWEKEYKYGCNFTADNKFANSHCFF